MTYWTQEADMPWIELAGEMILEFDAIDPTTGDSVADVSVSLITIYGDALGGGDVLADVIPAWTALEVEGQN